MVGLNFQLAATIEKCITEGFVVKSKRQPVVFHLKANEVTVKVHAVI